MWTRASFLQTRQTSPGRSAGSHVTRRHPQVGHVPISGHTRPAIPGDNTSVIIDDRSRESCREPLACTPMLRASRK